MDEKNDHNINHFASGKQVEKLKKVIMRNKMHEIMAFNMPITKIKSI